LIKYATAKNFKDWEGDKKIRKRKSKKRKILQKRTYLLYNISSYIIYNFVLTDIVLYSIILSLVLCTIYIHKPTRGTKKHNIGHEDFCSSFLNNRRERK